MSVEWVAQARTDPARVVAPEETLLACADADAQVRLSWTSLLSYEEHDSGLGHFSSRLGSEIFFPVNEVRSMRWPMEWLDADLAGRALAARDSRDLNQLAADLLDVAIWPETASLDDTTHDQNRLLKRLAWRCRAVATWHLDVRANAFSGVRERARDLTWLSVDRELAGAFQLLHPLSEAAALLDNAFEKGQEASLGEWGTDWLSYAACWRLFWGIHGHGIVESY